MARALVERDAETPEWRRRIEVGRGGLMLLATRLIELEEQLRSAETTLAHAEAFIEHQDMSYRWAEWCEGRDPNPPSGSEP